MALANHAKWLDNPSAGPSESAVKRLTHPGLRAILVYRIQGNPQACEGAPTASLPRARMAMMGARCFLGHYQLFSIRRLPPCASGVSPQVGTSGPDDDGCIKWPEYILIPPTLSPSAPATPRCTVPPAPKSPTLLINAAGKVSELITGPLAG